MKYVWIDLEMTGLNLQKDRIIEIACILTDASLETRIRGPQLVIHQPDSLLTTMNDWCIEHHGKSGLTDLVRNSTINTADAESQVLKFIKQHIPEQKAGILAGNSVHVDRQFLCQEMPELIEHLHYRIVDVSTIKELVSNWCPKIRKFSKKEAHRALDDIEESIAELLYYKTLAFQEY
jgi:oligoribonuclease